MHVKTIHFEYGKDAEGGIAMHHVRVEFELAPHQPGGGVGFTIETDDIASLTLGKLIGEGIRRLSRLNEAKVLDALHRKAVPQP